VERAPRFVTRITVACVTDTSLPTQSAGPGQSGVARQMAFYADCFPRSWREAPRGVCPGVTFAQRNGSELATVLPPRSVIL
jgi:hypothetical protein